MPCNRILQMHETQAMHHIVQFQEYLFEFLSKEWEKNEYATILANRVVYFATENTYYEFSSTNGVVSSVNMPTLSCQHEEADSRIIWHALYACTEMRKIQHSCTLNRYRCFYSAIILQETH